MRAVLVLLLVIACQLHAAQTEPNTKHGDRGASKSKQGTSENPVVVKVLPSAGDDAKARQEQHHKDNEARIADATVDLVYVTGILSIFTAFLFGATVFLARDARRTSD